MSKVLRSRYNKLCEDVNECLRKKIEKSKLQSKFVSSFKCLDVDFDDYREMIYYNDTLVLIDTNGYHYNANVVCSMEFLVELADTL